MGIFGIVLIDMENILVEVDGAWYVTPRPVKKEEVKSPDLLYLQQLAYTSGLSPRERDELMQLGARDFDRAYQSILDDPY